MPWQTCVCYDKTCFLLWQKYACCDKLLSRQNCLLRQNFCPQKIFVATNTCLSQWTYFCHNKRCVLSWQNYVCHDKYLSWQTCVCHNKSFVLQQAYFCHDKRCVLLRQSHVCCDKSMHPSRQNYVCCDKTILSQQFFFRDKHTFVTTKNVFCHDKTFVATKMILLAAPTNDSPICDNLFCPYPQLVAFKQVLDVLISLKETFFDASIMGWLTGLFLFFFRLSWSTGLWHKLVIAIVMFKITLCIGKRFPCFSFYGSHWLCFC